MKTCLNWNLSPSRKLPATLATSSEPTKTGVNIE